MLPGVVSPSTIDYQLLAQALAVELAPYFGDVISSISLLGVVSLFVFGFHTGRGFGGMR
jgi:hypothetical protein